MNENDEPDNTELPELLEDFFARQITSARLGLPYRQESTFWVDLGISEQLLDDAFQLLFSVRETIPRTVKIKTVAGLVTMALHTRITIESVWPVWLMIKQRLRALPEHAPLLLLLDPAQRGALFEMLRINMTYQHKISEGSLRLFINLAMDDAECAVDISDVLWHAIRGVQPPDNQYTLELIRGSIPPAEKRLRPIDFPLPERTLINGEAIYVVLHTLQELEQFWQAHRAEFPYAAMGMRCGPYQIYLDDYQWVFAKSKIALVKTVTRWDQVGITCRWCDWAEDAPADWSDFFLARDQHRTEKMAQGTWSDIDEANYQADCARRTFEKYRGWWELANLPDNCLFHEWLSPYAPVITDSSLSIEAATALLQEITFDDWYNYSDGGVCVLDEKAVDLEIKYWREEKEGGSEYYGMGNEHGVH
ncbi:MAG: hypothetical protein RL748_3399 [Pseudomonadota bacterium]